MTTTNPNESSLSQRNSQPAG